MFFESQFALPIILLAELGNSRGLNSGTALEMHSFEKDQRVGCRTPGGWRHEVL